MNQHPERICKWYNLFFAAQCISHKFQLSRQKEICYFKKLRSICDLVASIKIRGYRIINDSPVFLSTAALSGFARSPHH